MHDMMQELWLEILGVALLVIFIIIYNVSYAHSDRVLTCTVNNIDRVSTDSGSDARVYTENCGVLQNVDKWVIGKFDSADVQSQIREGKTYRFTVYGWRFGLFSMFPNIDKVEEVK